jgi:hypothetical protein
MIAPLLLAASFLALPMPRQATTPGGAEHPVIEKKTVTAGGVTVHFLTIPWGPNTFAAMEKGGESFYAKRTWPFARMQTTVPVTLEAATLPPGNYALVFHPNTPDDKGMSLEVRKIQVEEFLVPGNVMTKTPEGETVTRRGASFETVAETAPALALDLQPTAKGASLVIRYGDRRLVKELRF